MKELGPAEAVAENWGQLQARAQRRGRPWPHNDTWVAAFCLVDDLPLATLNTKDFADFAEHEGLGRHPRPVRPPLWRRRWQQPYAKGPERAG